MMRDQAPTRSKPPEAYFLESTLCVGGGEGSDEESNEAYRQEGRAVIFLEGESRSISSNPKAYNDLEYAKNLCPRKKSD